MSGASVGVPLFVYKKKRLLVLLEEEYYLCPINGCYHTNRKEWNMTEDDNPILMFVELK